MATFRPLWALLLASLMSAPVMASLTPGGALDDLSATGLVPSAGEAGPADGLATREVPQDLGGLGDGLTDGLFGPSQQSVDPSATVLDYYGPGCKTSAAPPTPATCGLYVFLVTGSAGGGHASATVTILPTVGGSSQRLGVGYGGFNLGFLVDAQPLSPIQVTVSVSAADGCDVDAALTWSAPAGGKLRGLQFSVGSTLSDSDPTWGDGRFGGSGQASATWHVQAAVCSHEADVEIDGPSLASLAGHFDDYTFSFTGVPGYVELDYDRNLWSFPGEEIHSIDLRHDGTAFSGSVGLGSYGSFSFTNLPQSISVDVAIAGGSSLSYLRAEATGSPAGGQNTRFEYHGSFGGVSADVTLDKVSSIFVHADVTDQQYLLDLLFYNNVGSVNVGVAGPSFQLGVTGSSLGSIDGSWDSSSTESVGSFGHTGVMNLNLDMPGSLGSLSVTRIPTSLDFRLLDYADGTLQSATLDASGGTSATVLAYHPSYSGGYIDLQASALSSATIRFEPDSGDMVHVLAGFAGSNGYVDGTYIDGNSQVTLDSRAVASIDLWISSSAPRIDLSTRLLYNSVNTGRIDLYATFPSVWINYASLNPYIYRSSPTQYYMEFPLDFTSDGTYGLWTCETGSFTEVQMCGLGP